jgi:hypothetical protein
MSLYGSTFPGAGAMLRFRSVSGQLAAMAIVAALAGGCMTWKTQSAAPAQVIAKKMPDRVRITRPDGSTTELVHPLIVGDTLAGTRLGSPGTTANSRIAIPLSDVQSVSIRQVNAGRTALLIGGLGVTAIAVIGAAASNDPVFRSPPPSSSGDPPLVSCPLVYSWDGTTWRLDSGTFGGAIAPALARTDVDNLVYATAQDGMLRLRVANELNETDYLDALSVLAVDHAPGLTVAPDGAGRIHSLGQLMAPATARDFRGADALPRVGAADGWSWESNPTRRDTAVAADIRDGLELVFPNPRVRNARLVLDGNNTPWASHLMQQFVGAHGRATQAWYDSLATYPQLARGLGTMLAQEAFLGVSVWADGQWQQQGYIWEAGPEIVKRQVFSLDLSRVQGNTLRIRLESAPSLWLIDYVALDSAAPSTIDVHEVFAQSATDHAGAGVGDRLRFRDSRYFVMEPGDGAEMRFQIPTVPAGRARSYLVRSSGWYRIHGPETAAPDTRILARVLTEPHGASRESVARFNDAMLTLSRVQP